jgi:hypothetical protein
MFFRKVRLFPHYTVLQLRKPYSSHYVSIKIDQSVNAVYKIIAVYCEIIRNTQTHCVGELQSFNIL